MGFGLAGTPAQPTCFPTMIHANANDGSRISCRAAPAMPPQSASSVLNCSRFGLIWTPDTLGWNYFAGCQGSGAIGQLDFGVCGGESPLSNAERMGLKCSRGFFA